MFIDLGWVNTDQRLQGSVSAWDRDSRPTVLVLPSVLSTSSLSFHVSPPGVVCARRLLSVYGETHGRLQLSGNPLFRRDDELRAAAADGQGVHTQVGQRRGRGRARHTTGGTPQRSAVSTDSGLSRTSQLKLIYRLLFFGCVF